MKRHTDVTPDQHGRHWMDEFGIDYKQRISVTKKQLESQMRPGRGRSLKTRAYAYLLLHSDGYRGERAVRQNENGELVPVVAADIVKELNQVARKHYRHIGETYTDTIKKEHMRRALTEIEAEGLLDRRVAGKPITQLTEEERQRITDAVELWVFLKPHSPSKSAIQDDWLVEEETQPEPPPSWAPRFTVAQLIRGFEIEDDDITEFLRSCENDPARQEILTGCIAKAREAFLSQLQTNYFYLEQKANTTEGVTESRPLGVTKRRGHHYSLNRYLNSASGRAGEQVEAVRKSGERTARPPAELRVIVSSYWMPDDSGLERLQQEIGDTPLEAFKAAVSARARRGVFGFGVLLETARRARQAWESAQKPDSPVETKSLLVLAEQARQVLADPEAEPWAIEWAREVLSAA